MGYNLIKATAYTKLFNLNSSLIATFCFALGGHIDYRWAGCMAIGQVLGGRLGAHLAITKGAALIRPLFVSVVTATICSLAYKSYTSSTMCSYLTHQFGTMPQFFLAGMMIMTIAVLYVKASRRSERS